MTKPETVRKAGLALGCVGTILILSIPIPIIPMAWAMVKAGYEYRHLESRMQSTVDAEEVREWARALLVKYPKDDAVPMQLKAEGQAGLIPVRINNPKSGYRVPSPGTCVVVAWTYTESDFANFEGFADTNEQCSATTSDEG